MKTVIKACSILIVFTILCGLVYPIGITGIAQIIFPTQANGSLVQKDGMTVGSKYIGQYFKDDKYFWSRPSASNYTKTKATNIAINSKEYQEKIQDRIKQVQESSQNTKEVPMELVVASGSGLDPNISVEAAEYQIERIAKKRGISEDKVLKLIQENTTIEPIVGIKMVNVLQLNIKLDEM